MKKNRKKMIIIGTAAITGAAVLAGAMTLHKKLSEKEEKNIEKKEEEQKAGLTVTKLRTNHLENPIGYEIGTLSLSWITQAADSEAKKEEAAQVEIFKGNQKIFDSGKQEALHSLDYYPNIELEPYTRYEWQVTVWADNGESETSERAFFETAKMEEEWTAKWITADMDKDTSPYMRKRFEVNGEIASARAYVCGVGLYELEINGEKVGDEYLMPGYSSYDSILEYQTYDITDMIKSGSNAVGSMLGAGWYKGRFFPEGGYTDIYGDHMSLLCELRIILKDGSVLTIGTDDSWKSKASPIVSSNIYDGEIYDAALEQDDWSMPSFDAREWSGVKYSEEGYERLSARYNEPIHIQETFTPELIVTPKGEYVLDFGQNMTGWVEFYINGEEDQQVTLSYGEILQDGCFYRDNLRTAKAAYVYTSDGTPAYVRPHFTFYGFRYVKVEGMSNINTEDFTACVVTSDLEQTGFIETSDEKVNQMFSNALWSQRDNFIDVPIDCPQRDERMGWTGDAAVFSSTACQNLYTPAFYRNYMKDVALEQEYNENGAIPLFVPTPKPKEAAHPYLNMKGEGISVWGDVATILPWNLYEIYGDESLLQEQYPVMKGWTDYIISQDNADGGKGLWLTGDKHLGDWLALDRESDDISNPFGATDLYYTASAFYYYSAMLTARAAHVLGYEEDIAVYEAQAEKIKNSILNTYFEPDGTMKMKETQTAYVIALYMKLYKPEWENDFTEHLKTLLDKNNKHLTTGFVGTPLLCRVLSEYGLNDYAYTLLLNEDYPSWLYEVNMGATTVWERWNSVLEDGSISETGMNSLNHYSYGSIVDWMYRNMCGLQPVKEAPGYKKAIIAPNPDSRIQWVKMKQETASGAYEIEWKYEEDGHVSYRIVVPFDCEAEFTRPGEEAITLQTGEYIFK